MFTHFADNQGVQPGAEYIGLFCDASLDEGDAIIRADFAPTLGSAGTEYFVQMDRHEVEATLYELEMSIWPGANNPFFEEIAKTTNRLRKLLNYMCDAETASNGFSGHSVKV